MTTPLATLCALLRPSLHRDGATTLACPVPDWETLYTLAWRHGVSAIVWGAVETRAAQMPRGLRLRWAANVAATAQRAQTYTAALTRLVGVLTDARFHPVVLKGATIAALYPEPWSRTGGDVDIYLVGEGEAARADEFMRSRGASPVRTCAKHSTFAFDGVTVENHHTLFDVDSAFAREAALYRAMESMIPGMPVCNDALSPHAAALFLVGHTFRHFCGVDMCVRQLCDWVVVFEKLGGSIDLELLERQIADLGLTRFFELIDSFCEAYLGFENPFCRAAQVDKLAPAAGLATPPPPIAGGVPGDPRGHRMLGRMLSNYRVEGRVPVWRSVRHIARRGAIYNRYLGPARGGEFVFPELLRYAKWVLRSRFWPLSTGNSGAGCRA